MKVLWYDTETQGLPLFHDPSDDPRQPHIVQIGAVLLDLATGERETLDEIIRPDGWIIPDETAAIHGITTERALAVGIPEDEAVKRFDTLWRNSAFRVAHNESFDCRILRIAYMRFFGRDYAEAWKSAPAQCTQKMATPILDLPPTDKMVRAGFGWKKKQASLAEAYRHFFGQDFADAHSAMADAVACMEVWHAIKGLPVPGHAPAAVTA